MTKREKIPKPTESATGICYCNSRCPCMDLRTRNGLDRVRYCTTKAGTVMLPEPVYLTICVVWARNQVKQDE